MCSIPDASLMIAGVLLVPVEWTRVVLRNRLKGGMIDREVSTIGRPLKIAPGLVEF